MVKRNLGLFVLVLTWFSFANLSFLMFFMSDFNQRVTVHRSLIEKRQKVKQACILFYTIKIK